jgi:hypothetical protein
VNQSLPNIHHRFDKCLIKIQFHSWVLYIGRVSRIGISYYDFEIVKLRIQISLGLLGIYVSIITEKMFLLLL